MEKTKLGISIALAAAATYLLALSGNFIPLCLFAGYIFLKEDSLLLKKHAVRAIGIFLIFSLVTAVLYLVRDIPNLALSPFNQLAGGISFLSGAKSWISKNLTGNWNWLFGFIGDIVSIVKAIVLLMATFKAIKGTEPKFGPVDKLLNQHFAQ